MKSKVTEFNSDLKKQSYLPKYNYAKIVKHIPQTHQMIVHSRCKLLLDIQKYAESVFKIPSQSLQSFKVSDHKQNSSSTDYPTFKFDSDSEDDFQNTVNFALQKKSLEVPQYDDKSTKKFGLQNKDRSQTLIPPNIVPLPQTNKRRSNYSAANSFQSFGNYFDKDQQNVDKNLAIWKSYKKISQNKDQKENGIFSFMSKPKQVDADISVDDLEDDQDVRMEVANLLRKTHKLLQEQVKINEVQKPDIKRDSETRSLNSLLELNDASQLINAQVQTKSQDERQRQSSRSSSYSMTSYSSNSSSNNKPHNIREVWEQFDEQTTVPVNLFLNKTESFCGMYPKLNLVKPVKTQLSLNPNISKTPRKSNKKKKRRLYCREKKIPSWAQDLNTVADGNKKIDPQKVFGVCAIHNLNIDYVFKNYLKNGDSKERFSVMKWRYGNFNPKKCISMPVIKEGDCMSDCSVE